jgi:hypothetical protein
MGIINTQQQSPPPAHMGHVFMGSILRLVPMIHQMHVRTLRITAKSVLKRGSVEVRIKLRHEEGRGGY